MGLDMYAYVATRPDQSREFWESASPNEAGDMVSATVAKPREIAYWRKHSSLHGWFRQEWKALGKSGSFNGDELEITWVMLERLEDAILERKLPETTGSFFGSNADEEYREQDLEFVRNARAELFLGLKVFYNSSW